MLRSYLVIVAFHLINHSIISVDVPGFSVFNAHYNHRKKLVAEIMSRESSDNLNIGMQETQVLAPPFDNCQNRWCDTPCEKNLSTSCSSLTSKNLEKQLIALKSQSYELASSGLFEVCTKPKAMEELGQIAMKMTTLLYEAIQSLDSKIPSMMCNNTCTTCDCTRANRKLIVSYKYPKGFNNTLWSITEIFNSAKKLLYQQELDYIGFRFEFRPDDEFRCALLHAQKIYSNSNFTSIIEKRFFRSQIRLIQRQLSMLAFYAEISNPRNSHFALENQKKKLDKHGITMRYCKSHIGSLIRTHYLPSLHMDIIELPDFASRPSIRGILHDLPYVKQVQDDIFFSWEGSPIRRKRATRDSRLRKNHKKIRRLNNIWLHDFYIKKRSASEGKPNKTEENLIRRKRNPPSKPDDTYFDDQWALSNHYVSSTNFLSSWEKTNRFKDVKSIPVAVIDSGIDLTQEDLVGILWHNTDEIAGNHIDDDGNKYIDDINGWDFTTSTPHVEDTVGHGTSVSGIIAANTNNSIGIASMCPYCKIMVLKVVCENSKSPKQRSSASWIVQAIAYAVDKKAKVINISGSGNAPIINDAVFRAGMAGLIIVASAGNDGVDLNLEENTIYPASSGFTNVVTVASVDKEGLLAGSSNYGSNVVTIGAPGKSILTTFFSSVYLERSGTSFAAPHVASLLGLICALRPQDSYHQNIKRLKNKARVLRSLIGKTKTGKVIDFDAVLMSILLDRVNDHFRKHEVQMHT